MKLNDAVRDRLLNADLLPDELLVGSMTFTVHSPVGAGISGAVWKCRDCYGRDRAVKLAIREHYDTRSYQEEIGRAARLERYSQFARLQDASIVEVTFKDGAKGSFV